MGPTKYVVGIHRGMFVEAIIFPERLQHNEIGIEVFGSTDNIVSAGFCYLDETKNKMVTYHRSSSLKIGPNEELDRYLLDVTMGCRQRLSTFDEESPPFGVFPDDARKLIEQRKERSNGQ